MRGVCVALVPLAVAGAAGACVCSMAAAAGAWLEREAVTLYLRDSALVGAVTGVLACAASAVFVRIAGRRPLQSLVGVATVTAAWAAVGSWAGGVRESAPFATILAVSEIVGVGSALLWVFARRRANPFRRDLERMRRGPQTDQFS